jgi:integrase
MVTLGEAAELWLQHSEREKLERSTRKQYRGHVDHHIKPLLGHVKLSELTTPRVQKFANTLLGRQVDADHRGNGDGTRANLSRATARKILVSLKSIIKEAQRLGLLAKNPAAAVSIKVSKRGTRKIQAGRDFPDKEEINALLKTADGKWRPFFLTAVFSGMRASELRGLRWSDVDLKAGVFHVRQRADAWGEIGEPKSQAGTRDIPMPPIVVNALKEWKLKCPKGDLDLVFPNGAGNLENHGNLTARGYYALQREAGVTKRAGTDKDGKPVMKPKYGLHTLRHFYASWLIEQGWQPKRVQTLLGHSSIVMTYDVYGHLFPSDDDDRKRLAQGAAALLS